MGLAVLILGLVLFLGIHTVVALTTPRARLMGKLGPRGHRLLVTALSVVGLVLIVYGYALYRRTGYVELWSAPTGMRHLAITLMLPAFIFLVAAYVPGHIRRVLRHPMLVAVKIWAFVHLLANGDLGSVVLFGSFLAWAVFDRIAVKRRERAGDIRGPGASARPVSWRNDLVAVVVGVLLYLAMGYVFHPLWIGVPAFAR